MTSSFLGCSIVREHAILPSGPTVWMLTRRSRSRRIVAPVMIRGAQKSALSLTQKDSCDAEEADTTSAIRLIRRTHTTRTGGSMLKFSPVLHWKILARRTPPSTIALRLRRIFCACVSGGWSSGATRPVMRLLEMLAGKEIAIPPTQPT